MLADYRSNIPQARDAEVLDLLAVLATRISASISQEAGGEKRATCGSSQIPKVFLRDFELISFFGGKDTRNGIYTHIYIFRSSNLEKVGVFSDKPG